MKVSDYIANFFVKNDVNKCFTVTGGGAMHLNDSFGHHDKIHCIYNHHEQACSMSAEGYSRISGKPAIVCVTSGPGTTNTLTGVLGAWLDSIPMIIISGQMSCDTIVNSTPLPLRQLGFQEYNIIDSVRSMTKYAEVIDDVRYVPYHLEKALELAISGRKGPVWLDIPIDIQSAKIDFNSCVSYHGDYFPKPPDFTKLNQIKKAILKSKKPTVLAGYGVRMSNSYKEFLDFVNKLNIPVLTEWNSNDLIWNNHKLYAGNPGSIGNRGGNFVLQNSDLLLMIGCQLSIRQTTYAWKNFAKSAIKISINEDEYELSKPTIKPDIGLHCNIKEFFNNFDLDLSKNYFSKWLKWCKKINLKYPVVKQKINKSENFLSIYNFIDELSDYLPENVNVVLANGAACVAGFQAFKVKKNQRIFTNAGASSMGYAISACIGTSVSGNPNVRTFCIEGDGSIQMNLQELQTIVHNKLDIKIFWINNDGYHSIKQTQNAMFDAGKKGLCGADKTSGISFPSAERIAYAYGIKYYKIEKNSNISLILKDIDSYREPVLCEVVTDPNETFEPKVQSKMLEDGTFFTPSLEDMYPFLSDAEMKENYFEGS